MDGPVLAWLGDKVTAQKMVGMIIGVGRIN